LPSTSHIVYTSLSSQAFRQSPEPYSITLKVEAVTCLPYVRTFGHYLVQKPKRWPAAVFKTNFVQCGQRNYHIYIECSILCW
jgi:hypothetical protein